MFKNRLLISFLLLIAVPFMSSAQTNSLVIPAYAFYPMSDDAEWFANLGEIRIEGTSPDGKLRASVFLPEGAIIKKVILRYTTRGGDITFTMTLYRRNMYTDVEQVVTNMTPPQTGADFQNFATYSIAYRTVNNSGYCYYIVIDMPLGLGLPWIAGVKILYE